ncbi:hypothetical protein CH373_02455 [Leptospira perolatii]|uniref:VOC domain-containing protein n=1 Tax=Leptospira perolatii TaxID=2023191 RepID=A0A2M9ZSB5_9LEPT|nr:VOC family protein [Leptospira perolatii]PJZ71380.1 hypothetical protein CH360_02455 [Leptospira perolatii]PJZ74914.1 hypothetical protein CH373_02455 [Leptospira perolatii]
MAKVLGIGGVFYKSNNKSDLLAWYKKHLGIAFEDENVPAFTLEKYPNGSVVVLGLFEKSTKYFEPSTKEFMINFVVDDLVQLMEKLKSEGIEPTAPMLEEPYGKFCWIMDPDGNKIELWEPIP